MGAASLGGGLPAAVGRIRPHPARLAIVAMWNAPAAVRALRHPLIGARGLRKLRGWKQPGESSAPRIRHRHRARRRPNHQPLGAHLRDGQLARHDETDPAFGCSGGLRPPPDRRRRSEIDATNHVAPYRSRNCMPANFSLDQRQRIGYNCRVRLLVRPGSAGEIILPVFLRARLRPLPLDYLSLSSRWAAHRNRGGLRYQNRRNKARMYMKTKDEHKMIGPGGSADRRFSGLRLFYAHLDGPQTPHTVVRVTKIRGTKPECI